MSSRRRPKPKIPTVAAPAPLASATAPRAPVGLASAPATVMNQVAANTAAKSQPTQKTAAQPTKVIVVRQAQPGVSKNSGVGMVVSNAGKVNAVASAGRTLFGEGNQFLSPTQIANLLAVMGVPIPPEARVGLDVAQIVVAGGAIATAAETGAELGSYASPTAAACQAAVDILATTGLIKKDDPNVILLEVGLDIILIVASYGSNIGAWIDLAVNIYKLSQIPAALKAQAQNEANKAVAEWYQNREQGQYNAMLANFQDYHNGTLDTFDFMNVVAKDSPDFFLKAFPSFAPWTPQTNVTFSVTVTEESDFCGVPVASGSGSASKTVQSIDYSVPWMQSMLMATIVEPVLRPFEIFENQNPRYMTINALALLATVPPYLQFVPPGLDVAGYMLGCQLTPGDLGSTCVEDAILSNSLYENNQDFEAPITFNGVEYRDPATQIQYQNTRQYQNEIQKIRDADKNGDINFLLSLDQVAKVINDWAAVVVNSGSGNAYSGLNGFTGYLNPDNPNLLHLGVPPNDKWYTKDEFANLWRYPQQYVKALQMVHEMRKSTILSVQSKPFAKYIANVDDFMAQHKDLLTKSIARAANRKALETIAGYFGTTPDKIELISDPKSGAPAQFRVIP